MQPQKPWFEIRNAAAENGPVEILIYGRIGASYYDKTAVGAKDFADALAKISPEKEILVCLNSPGGNVWDGLAIYHQLQARREKVVCRVDGLAASIASIIAMAGRETRIPANALLMIHDPSSLAYGRASDMRKMADTLDTHKKVLVGIYHSKAGKPLAEIEKKMSDETWFTGSDAKEFGLADTVTDQVALTALAEFDLSNFKNVPTLDALTPVDSPTPEDMTKQESPAAETTLLEKIKALLGVAPAAAAPAEAASASEPAEIQNFKNRISDLEAQLATAKAATTDKEKEVETRSNAKAAETIAKVGHTAVTTETPQKAAPKTGPELWAEFKRIQKDEGQAAARNFYVANKAAM